MQNGVCTVWKPLCPWPSGECTLPLLIKCFSCANHGKGSPEALLAGGFISCVLLTLLLFYTSAPASYIEIDAGWQSTCDVCWMKQLTSRYRLSWEIMTEPVGTCTHTTKYTISYWNVPERPYLLVLFFFFSFVPSTFSGKKILKHFPHLSNAKTWYNKH